MTSPLFYHTVVEEQYLVRVETACKSVTYGDGCHIFAQAVKIAIQLPLGYRVEVDAVGSSKMRRVEWLTIIRAIAIFCH